MLFSEIPSVVPNIVYLIAVLKAVPSTILIVIMIVATAYCFAINFHKYDNSEHNYKFINAEFPAAALAEKHLGIER